MPGCFRQSLHPEPCDIEIVSPSVRRRVLSLVLQSYLDGSSVCLEPFGTGEASRNRSDFGEATWRQADHADDLDEVSDGQW